MRLLTNLNVTLASLLGFALIEGCPPPAAPATCENIEACSEVTDPLDWTFKSANFTPGPGHDSLFSFGAGDLDTTWEGDELNAQLKLFWDTLPYPFRPYEVITKEGLATYDNSEAVEQFCPCDSSLAILNYEQLSSEERAQKAQQDKDIEEEGEGSGNAIIAIPRFVGVQTNDYSDVWKNLGFRIDTTNSTYSRDSAVLIAILDTGLDSNLLKDLSDQNAIVEAKQLLSSSSVHDNIAMHDSSGHGSNVTAIIEHISNGTAKYLIYKTHNADGIGSTFSVVCALRCAVNAGADIINMSFGAYNKIEAIDFELDKIASTVSPTPILIASKGNEGINTDDLYHTPSDNKNVLGATGMNTGINLGADADTPESPGPPIHWECSNFSVDDINNTAAPAKLVGEKIGPIGIGTSYAAPFITGIKARTLAKTRHPAMYSDVIGSHTTLGLCNKILGIEYTFKTIE